MAYFTRHGNRFRFQIRVPARARERYGSVIRVDLQTDDPQAAKVLSLRLAAEWLTRFVSIDGDDIVRGPLGDSKPRADTVVPADAPQLTAAFQYWRELTPNRPPRTLLEFQRTAESFDTIVGKPLPALTRRDIAHYRDTLLADGGWLPPPSRSTSGSYQPSCKPSTTLDACLAMSHAAFVCRDPKSSISAALTSRMRSCARCSAPLCLRNVIALAAVGARPRPGFQSLRTPPAQGWKSSANCAQRTSPSLSRERC